MRTCSDCGKPLPGVDVPPTWRLVCGICAAASMARDPDAYLPLEMPAGPSSASAHTGRNEREIALADRPGKG